MTEVNNPSLTGWTVQKDTDEIKIWIRQQGINSAPDLPLIQVEYYFPEVDDIKIIQAALLDFRD